jgi:hypothetical protein
MTTTANPASSYRSHDPLQASHAAAHARPSRRVNQGDGTESLQVLVPWIVARHDRWRLDAPPMATVLVEKGVHMPRWRAVGVGRPARRWRLVGCLVMVVVGGLPRSGEVVRLDRGASVQFAAVPILFRVIRVHDWSTYDGWVWLDGYELNSSGEAIDRRSVYVMVAGVQRAQVTLPKPRKAAGGVAGRTELTGGGRRSRGDGRGGKADLA